MGAGLPFSVYSVTKISRCPQEIGSLVSILYNFVRPSADHKLPYGFDLKDIHHNSLMPS